MDFFGINVKVHSFVITKIVQEMVFGQLLMEFAFKWMQGIIVNTWTYVPTKIGSGNGVCDHDNGTCICNMDLLEITVKL